MPTLPPPNDAPTKATLHCVVCGYNWHPKPGRGGPASRTGLPRHCPCCGSIRWRADGPPNPTDYQLDMAAQFHQLHPERFAIPASTPAAESTADAVSAHAPTPHKLALLFNRVAECAPMGWLGYHTTWAQLVNEVRAAYAASEDWAVLELHRVWLDRALSTVRPGIPTKMHPADSDALLPALTDVIARINAYCLALAQTKRAGIQRPSFTLGSHGSNGWR